MSPLCFHMGLMEDISRQVGEFLAADQFLVEVILKGTTQQKVLVLVDGDKGITIDDCAKVSRQLAAWLEEEDAIEGKYLLEVSSPGLDHPLKDKRQYYKNVGRKLRVTKVDDTVVEGKLNKVGENEVTLAVKPDKKKPEVDVTLNFDDIAKTMVLVSFN